MAKQKIINIKKKIYMLKNPKYLNKSNQKIIFNKKIRHKILMNKSKNIS